MDLKEIFESINDMNEKETIKISYYIIKHCKDNKIEITNLKLNKLLYFINIQYMLENSGIPIFDEEFLAWRHGPILQSVYNQFCLGLILPPVDKLNSIVSSLSKNKIEIIDRVLKRKASTPAWKLVEETHISNGPWENVYKNNKDVNGICKASISNKDIYHFYKEYSHVI